MGEIWYENPEILFWPLPNLLKISPFDAASEIEKENAYVRLILIIGALAYYVLRKERLGGIVILITVLAVMAKGYKFHEKEVEIRERQELRERLQFTQRLIMQANENLAINYQ